MTEDLKIILVFISIDLMSFITTALKKAAIFFIGLTLIISSFFIGLRAELPFLYVIAGSIILILLLHITKESLFKKSQFIFNNNFVKFLLKEKKKIEPDVFSKKELKDVKSKLVKGKNISSLKRTVLSFYVMSSIKKDIFTNYNKNLKKELVKIHMAGYGLFFILLFFFELISLALAFGNNIQSDILIFLSLIGFIFTYALFSVTIDPIMHLLIQKKVAEN